MGTHGCCWVALRPGPADVAEPRLEAQIAALTGVLDVEAGSLQHDQVRHQQAGLRRFTFRSRAHRYRSGRDERHADNHHQAGCGKIAERLFPATRHRFLRSLDTSGGTSFEPEPARGLEPLTPSLQVKCAASCARPASSPTGRVRLLVTNVRPRRVSGPNPTRIVTPTGHPTPLG